MFIIIFSLDHLIFAGFLRLSRLVGTLQMYRYKATVVQSSLPET